MENTIETITKMIEILAKQNATPEEKLVQSLIKAALLSDSLGRFMNEVNAAVNGFGKVHTQTVKDTVEFFKANNEAMIRKTDYSDEQKEVMVKQEIDRLTEVCVWILGTLALWGVLV